MCLQDLNLGRGRYVGTIATATTPVDRILKANPQRVAILISFAGRGYYDVGNTSPVFDSLSVWSGDTLTGKAVLLIGSNSNPVILKVEEVGQLIMGDISVYVSNQSGLATVSVVEILNKIEGKPAFTDRDLK